MRTMVRGGGGRDLRTGTALTAEGMRAAIAAFADSQRVDVEVMREAGVNPEDLVTTLFAVDRTRDDEPVVRFEVRDTGFSLPEKGIVAAMSEAQFVHTVLRPAWEGAQELTVKSQPQAQWAVVAAVLETRTRVLNHVVASDGSAPNTAGGGLLAGMSGVKDGSVAQGVTDLALDSQRRVVPMSETDIVVRVVLADLSRSDLIDPNMGMGGRTDTDIANYVSKGRIMRLMPASVRRARMRCLDIVKQEAALNAQEGEHRMAEDRKRLSHVTQEMVDALRKAKFSDEDIARTYGAPVEAFRSLFGVKA